MIRIVFFFLQKTLAARKKKRVVLLCFSVIFSLFLSMGESWAQGRRKKVHYLETGAERKLEVPYKRVGGEELKLDVYYPTAKRTKRNPVIFFAHGGGWGAGDKYNAASGLYAPLFLKLLKHGFIVISIDYRLWKKDGSVYVPDCVSDCKDAMRFIARQAERFEADPERFFCIGGSAGGHLAQMMLLTPPETFPGDPQLAHVKYKMIAGVSWFGFTNFEEKELFIKPGRSRRGDPRAGTIVRILRPGLREEEKEKVLHEMSPTSWLRPTMPPLLLFQGDHDTAVTVQHAYYMKKKAKAAQAPVTVVIVRNAGHNWKQIGSGSTPSKEKIIDMTCDFFLSHLSCTAQGGN
ncbi:MAG: alpha/beta hydrolase [Lentisphaerae bacterium]|nr:MAG: alpha/beta hydrolase [Lentisphaerota bacterium]